MESNTFHGRLASVREWVVSRIVLLVVLGYVGIPILVDAMMTPKKYLESNTERTPG